MWLTAPSRPVVNYSARCERPADRSKHRTRTWGRQVDLEMAVGHQNFPPGIFLFTINSFAKFDWILQKPGCTKAQGNRNSSGRTFWNSSHSFTCRLPPAGNKHLTFKYNTNRHVFLCSWEGWASARLLTQIQDFTIKSLEDERCFHNYKLQNYTETSYAKSSKQFGNEVYFMKYAWV